MYYAQSAPYISGTSRLQSRGTNSYEFRVLLVRTNGHFGAFAGSHDAIRLKPKHGKNHKAGRSEILV